MAKYTDPNTGVKYSTHTGLKVFTVIVVILLVISVVLNVVLYMQSSDDSVIDSGENGEFDDQDEDGQDGDEDEGENGNIVFAPVDEDIVDTDTVIDIEDDPESYRVIRTSDFDEYGCATCIYYYPDENWVGENGDFYGCSYCYGPCEGHEYYITKGGSVYSFRVAVDTRALEAEDGSTDINSKIRASLIFDVQGSGVSVNYIDYYYDMCIEGIEVVSLTGEPLEVESVELRQYVYYKNTATSLWNAKWAEYHSESGISLDLGGRNVLYAPNDTITYYGRSYSDDGASGQFVFSITLADGKTYSFDYWIIYNSSMLDCKDVEYVA